MKKMYFIIAAFTFPKRCIFSCQLKEDSKSKIENQLKYSRSIQRFIDNNYRAYIKIKGINNDIKACTNVFAYFTKYIGNDFLGELKHLSVDIKKIKVLEIYRNLFRFSMEKVKGLVDNPTFMVMTLEYIKGT